MKKTKKLLWLIIIPIVICSCKKGEEDPFISFNSRKKRLTGKWEVKEYYFETVDLLNPNTIVFYENYTLEFQDDGDFIESFVYYDEDRNKSINTYKGIWDFENDKENLQVFYNSRVREYNIVKLSKNELKLSYYSDSYKVVVNAEK